MQDTNASFAATASAADLSSTPREFRSYIAPAEEGVSPHVLGVLSAVILLVLAIAACSLYRWIQRHGLPWLVGKDFKIKTSGSSESDASPPGCLRISHSLPDIKGRSENFWTGQKKVAPLRQITLPIVPTRHQTFRRQLAQQIEPVHLPFEVCQVPQRSSLPVGNIQPELYRPELMRESSSDSTPGPETTPGVACGKLLFTLKYDTDLESLVVWVLEARDLPAKDFSGSSDPYLKIYLLPDRKKKYQTRVHRKTLNPVFNETFVFPVPYDQLGSRTLQFSVYDFDRFSRHDLIGHVIVKGLDELGDGISTPSELECTMDILGVPQEKKGAGELMLSLCYLPTAGRLTVTILKARHLKSMDINGTSDPYVKVSLVCQGRRIKKKKTSVRRCTLNPVYNEALVFDIPVEHTDDVMLLIKVLDYDRVGSNELIGCCAIGSSCIGQGRDHWLAMLENPRKPVAQWYPLLEAVPTPIPPSGSDKPPTPCLSVR